MSLSEVLGSVWSHCYLVTAPELGRPALIHSDLIISRRETGCSLSPEPEAHRPGSGDTPSFLFSFSVAWALQSCTQGKKTLLQPHRQPSLASLCVCIGVCVCVYTWVLMCMCVYTCRGRGHQVSFLQCYPPHSFEKWSLTGTWASLIRLAVQ